MVLKYHMIEIFTSEEARYKGRPLYQAVLEHVRGLKIAARAVVTKAVAGCYENGEIATYGIEILSFNMPLKIEIIMPAPELDVVLPGIEEMVTDGIVVVEDMNVRVHRTKSCLLPRQLKVRDVMTPQPRSVSPETPAGEVARLLLSTNFNGVPVVDAQNIPVGIITQGDLISRAQMPVRLGLLEEMDRDQVHTLLNSMSQRSAGEIMSHPAVTVGADEVLVSAVELMLKKGLKRLPVVDEHGRLVGILARLDIFRAIAKETPNWSDLQSRQVQIPNARFVRDIMRRDTHLVLPDAPVPDVIKVIDTSDIQRVAVVDAEGRFLGLISDRILLGAFAEHRAGLWDYLISKLSFTEIGQRHKAFLESLQAKTACEVMQTDLVTVREETPIAEAIRIMAQKQIKRLPVLDGEGKFKGMVSRDSLLRAGLAQA